MKYFSRLHILGIFLLFYCPIYSQQLPIYSQNTFNAFLHNPATAGSDGYTTINTTSRQQWIGIKGAPQFGSINFQTRLFKQSYIRRNAPVKKRFNNPLRSGKIGLGLNIFCDRANALHTNGALFTYAYHITRSKSQLSFGFTTGFYQFSIDRKNLLFNKETDKLLNESTLDIFYTDFNAGIYYSNSFLFTGFSVSNLMQTSISFGNYTGNYRLFRLYNAEYGMQISLDNSLSFEPSVLVRFMKESIQQLDISGRIIANKKYWCGLTWRTPDIFIFLGGTRINRLFIGYSFDYSLNPLYLSSYGTHELMLSIKLGDNTRRYRWIERY